jgi:hypothetical protein
VTWRYDEFGFVFDQDGLLHWAPWQVTTPAELAACKTGIETAGGRGWVLCEKGEGRERHHVHSTSTADVTCLSCLALMRGSWGDYE